MTRNTLIAAIALSLFTGPVFAQNPPDAAALIASSIANAEQNAKAALAYTFHENYVSSVYSSASGTGIRGGAISGAAGSTRSVAGSPTDVATQDNGGGGGETSTQYDVLFIEGIPYRRVTGLNHLPINAESAAAESKRYDAAVAYVHTMSEEQRREMVKNNNEFLFDPKLLTTQYDCKITGHEKVQKRPATVVQCKLRDDLPTPGADATGPTIKDVKLWIDDQQPFFVRTRAVLNHIDKERKLNNLTIQWSLIDGVWHQTSAEVDWVATVGPSTRGKSTDTFSDFKKFRTEATVLPGFLPVLPLPPQP
jgi:hypothetical protein